MEVPVLAARRRHGRPRANARSRRPKQRPQRHWLLRLSLITLIVISLTALAGTGATVGIVDYFAGDLPSMDQIQAANLMQATQILDRNGKLIESVYHENRTVVTLSQISQKLQRATIDTEDR
ncbi:MAG TPA: hypothetical protein VEW68_11195, partial [Patescibacteria group bacterium]|nr:hypothetical protein [Patescibacteria group bacterium]